MKTIWALFSIDNEYDQPSNNLVAWWANKPSCAEIKDVLPYVSDVVAGKLYRGLIIKEAPDYTEYRIEQVNEGKIDQQ